MDREQFTFYRSFWEAIRGLPRKERQEALEAVIEYALYEKNPNLSGVPFSVFVLIRPTLDASRNKAKNRKNKTRTNEEQNAKEGEKEREGESKRESKNECYKEISKESTADKPPTTPRFKAPNVDEVRAYCLESGYTAVDPERFVDFYQSKGWKVGREPMKDWKAAVRNWNRKENPNGKNEIQLSGRIGTVV